MTKSTFHSHSRFDDGQEELEAYIESALTKNFQVFGFCMLRLILKPTGLCH